MDLYEIQKRNCCKPFFYFSGISNPSITLKRNIKIDSDYKLKIKEALENAANKPFSRASVLILSRVEPLCQRAVCVGLYFNITNSLNL